MKINKRCILLISLIIIFILIIFGYFVNKRSVDTLSFENLSFYRDNGSDIEYIRFSDDFTFSYYEASGNAVDDYDLCKTYKYSKKHNLIKLKCYKGVEVTKLLIVNYDEKTLILKFGNEDRVFYNMSYEEILDKNEEINLTNEEALKVLKKAALKDDYTIDNAIVTHKGSNETYLVKYLISFTDYEYSYSENMYTIVYQSNGKWITDLDGYLEYDGYLLNKYDLKKISNTD